MENKEEVKTEVKEETTKKTTKKASDKTAESTTEKDIHSMNIFQKLSAITAELKTVGKNMEVGTGNNKYKAVSERDILDAVKPTEEKYGIYSYPFAREVLESHILESESTYNGNTTKKSTFMTRIMTTYRFVNTDNPSEYIDTTTFSEGIDSQDKGSGKAMTYGDKYALMKIYKISTGDDPDAVASEDTNYTSKSAWGKPQNNAPQNNAPQSNAPQSNGWGNKPQNNAPQSNGGWGNKGTWGNK